MQWLPVSGELSRRPYGTMGFIDTDYFRDNIIGMIPNIRMKMQVIAIPNMPGKTVERFRKLLVQDALSCRSPTLARKCKLSLTDAAVARRVIMGISTDERVARVRIPKSIRT